MKGRFVARGRDITIERPLIMGIVNLCADSFSGDGIEDPRAALDHARSLVRAGADIIDVGAESARTNRPPMSVGEETDRLIHFLQGWQEQPPAMLSINTWRSEVAKAVLPLGGDILNDMGGLPDPENAALCAANDTALVIMHTRGAPKVAQTHVRYGDVMDEIERFFEEKIAVAVAAGVSREAVIIDPGIDFAKQRDDNLRIYRELDRLRRFERPILLPVSRKTVIGDVLGIADPRERDAGTVACIVAGQLRGASIFRVHNVRAAARTIAMISALGGVTL
jgi:dihydropteroate synthase